MILDSSAVIAILLNEPDATDLLEIVGRATTLAIGGPTLAETGIVLAARLKADSRGLLSRFLEDAGVEVIAFGAEHAREAVGAFRRFGKGHHRAALNFGDCMTYAIARLADLPLIATGEDFKKTDLKLA